MQQPRSVGKGGKSPSEKLCKKVNEPLDDALEEVLLLRRFFLRRGRLVDVFDVFMAARTVAVCVGGVMPERVDHRARCDGLLTNRLSKQKAPQRLDKSVRCAYNKDTRELSDRRLALK